MTHPTTDLLIHLRPQTPEGSYPVEARLEDGSRFSGGRFQPDMETLRRAALDPQTYGLSLFYALFNGPIRRAYDRAWGRAGEGGLRIRLWIDREAAALHALKWEQLHYVDQGITAPLSASARTPFARYLDLEKGHPPPLDERPLRLVAALANPTDLQAYGLAPIDVFREVEVLIKALRGLTRTGQLDVTLLTGRTALPDSLHAHLSDLGWQVLDVPTTLDNVLRALEANGGAHALHLVAHGALRTRDGVAVLFLEDAEGAAQITPDREIAKQLHELASRPRLVFLAPCESAARDPDNANPFVGLAPKLVRAGVPAVVAMQDSVPIRVVHELTQDFYRHLLDHGQVDRALNQARLLLYEETSPAWAIPVLFTHLPDGQLLVEDPVRTALSAMVEAPQFNPLAKDEDYIPLNALYLTGEPKNLNLEQLRRERTSAQEINTAFQHIFSRKTPCCVALIGDAGMGKSLQMKRLGRLTAEASLAPNAARVVIPVYIDLQALRAAPLVGPADVEALILKALTPFWPTEGKPQPADLVTAREGPILRILIDGSDSLPDHVRRRLWAAVDRFARRRSRHQYVVAHKSTHFAPQLLPLTDVLVLQPLSPGALTHYLTQRLGTPVALRLYGAIERHRLHDLAALPWLLVQMLRQTQRGTLPTSRAEVLEHYVTDIVADLARNPGMRALINQTLDALAWRMQSTFRSRLPLDEAFEIMAQVRGHRDYDLEAFFSALVTHDLLTPVGTEALTFARDEVRAYVCARALTRQKQTTLDEVLATLGRRSRYRWWQKPLTLLAGLPQAPSSLMYRLLHDAALDEEVTLDEGELVFLAAHMLREGRREGEERLRAYVVGALLLRLDSRREPQVELRAWAAEALGDLEARAAVPRLISVALEKVRGSPASPKYEYSTVRLAALRALRRILPRPYTDVATYDERLAQMMTHWTEHDVKALAHDLHHTPTREGANIQGLTALTLGELGTQAAVDVLIEAFLAPDQDAALYRSVSTALTLIDPAQVTRRVVLPLLEEAEEEPRRLGPRLANLIYLIGRVRVPAQKARDFLRRCLETCAPIHLKGLTIQSLGWLHAVEYKETFEAVALGAFEALQLVGPLSDATQRYLQRKALEALAYLGDMETLKRLKQEAFTWDPELEMAFYRTHEEILVHRKQTT
ncbi:MAG: CHAT domain-containing protein [Anaerolineae bacterium]